MGATASLGALADPPAPASVSLVALGIGCVVAFFILMAFLAWANPGRNSGFLEWDPEAQAQFRGEVERADLDRMLHEHNRRRAENGLAPQSMDEFREDITSSGA